MEEERFLPEKEFNPGADKRKVKNKKLL